MGRIRLVTTDRKYFFVLLLSQAISLQALSQPDSASGFFPLHSGDVHQFNYYYNYRYGPGCESTGTHSSYHMEQAGNDSLMPNGRLYKLIQSDVPFEPAGRFLRVDTLTANVYEYSGDTSRTEYLFDSLRAAPGSGFMREAVIPVSCVAVDTLIILGEPRMTKHFVIGLVPPEYYSLSYGLGRVQHIRLDQDACLPLVVPYTLDLHYARINNQEYGWITAVRSDDGQIPAGLDLRQNYPNPFNPATTIEINLPKSGFVTLAIFNTLGERITTLASGEMPAGTHRFTWSGIGVPSGIYYYRVQTGNSLKTMKLILLK